MQLLVMGIGFLKYLLVVFHTPPKEGRLAAGRVDPPMDWKYTQCNCTATGDLVPLAALHDDQIVSSECARASQDKAGGVEAAEQCTKRGRLCRYVLSRSQGKKETDGPG